MKTTLLCVLLVLFLGVITCAPTDPNKCLRDSSVFATRHSMQIGTEQANREQGNIWRQAVAVVAPVDLGSGPQWLEVAKFDFWQDNMWAGEESCCWNETQAWPRIDPVSGEFMLAFQRIFVCPTEPFFRRNFDTIPPVWEEAQSKYTVEWYKGAYLEESAIVIGTSPQEYALGDKVTSAAWYRADGSLPYVNTLVNYVDGFYRTYTVNTFLEAIPGDVSTSYKVMGDITSTSELPPALVSQAFEWFDQVIDDDNHQTVISPVTGLGEYIFVPSQHASRDARNTASTDLNMNPSVDMTSHKSIQKAIASKK